jgi:hypothetical protein
MNRVRVKSADPTATLSLALYDDKDEYGCYTINFKDITMAESHGFYLWRPHHQAAADAAIAAGQAGGKGTGPAHDSGRGSKGPEDPGIGQDEGAKARLRQR